MPKVFLSHSSADKPQVADIKRRLEERLPETYELWIDFEQLDAGLSLVTRLNEGLKSSEVAVVFLGTEGVGPWHGPEIDVVIARAIESNIRLVVVLLPGAQALEMPALLSRHPRVEFKTHCAEAVQIDHLLRGITGVDPSATLTVDPKAVAFDAANEAKVTSAATKLSELLCSQKNVIVFLGPGTAPFGKTFPLRSSDVAYDLLRELTLIDDEYQDLLPPVDIAGAYYEIKKGSELLESRIIGLIAGRSERVPATHSMLADLFKLLKQRPKTRIAPRNRQLIVTTNLDLMIERALLLARVPFTRVVQYRKLDHLEVNVYSSIERQSDGSLEVRSEQDDSRYVFPRDDIAGLEEAITQCGRSVLNVTQGSAGSSTGEGLRLEKYPEPVLYKLRGSVDVGGSCLLTTDQYLNFVRLSKGALPSVITSIVNTSPAVFLGYSLLDPDFRLIWHSLAREAEATDRYAVEASPLLEKEDLYRRMDVPIWEELRTARLRTHGVDTIEATADQFLHRWNTVLARRLGVG